MSNRVKERREELGMSQENLAEKAMVSRVTVSQIETGAREVVSSKTMMNIARALQSPVTNIFFPEEV